MTLLIFRKTKVYIRLLYISDILIDTANHIFERLREILREKIFRGHQS